MPETRHRDSQREIKRNRKRERDTGKTARDREVERMRKSERNREIIGKERDTRKRENDATDTHS